MDTVNTGQGAPSRSDHVTVELTAHAHVYVSDKEMLIEPAHIAFSCASYIPGVLDWFHLGRRGT